MAWTFDFAAKEMTWHYWDPDLLLKLDIIE
jgi:hypothetical protein